MSIHHPAMQSPSVTHSRGLLLQRLLLLLAALGLLVDDLLPSGVELELRDHEF